MKYSLLIILVMLAGAVYGLLKPHGDTPAELLIQAARDSRLELQSAASMMLSQR